MPLKQQLMKQYFLLGILACSLFSYAKKDKKTNAVINYPTSTKINHTDTYFGTVVDDPYQWLEDDTSSATGAWVDAQNKVTFDYLSQIPYRQQLKDRYKELYDYAKINEPVVAGDYIFYSK